MRPVLKIYRGYANEQEIIVCGHFYRTNASNSYTLDGGKHRHACAILRMFSIKPFDNSQVEMTFENKSIITKTVKDGYFRFSIPYAELLSFGWHSFKVKAEIDGMILEESGEFIKPYPGEFGLISDIDDTFLLSHSNSFFRKLYVLLTHNVHRRKIFEGVVQHYQLLSHAGNRSGAGSNAFFYVSSSEWNLYNLIERFAKLNNLPKAVIQLKDIKKGLRDFLVTGAGSHDHKFQKIKHILEFYPKLKFILLGDDSQKDPFIYQRIVKMFPMNVKVIYIRQTKNKPRETVKGILANIDSMSVTTFYYKESIHAINHSKNLGLVGTTF